MKLINVEKEGKLYTFICKSRNTRNGFAHECDLFVNGQFINENTCYYLNRTWEYYEYQTVCIGAINKAIEHEKRILTYNFKSVHSLQRLSKKRKEELQQVFDHDYYP